MSNLLKSKPDDLTPQGTKVATIITNIVEICQSGTTATRTGTEFSEIKAHQNSVFTYKGVPVTYVEASNGIFKFNVWEISDKTPVMKSYSVDNRKVITAGSDISIGKDLPDVSAEDNGKVAKVVSGKWDKADESTVDTTPFDLIFTADASARITPNTESATITNPSFTATKTMTELLDKFNTYKQLSMGGGFKWSTTVSGQALDYYATATINDITRVPNAFAKVAYSSLPIGDKDVLVIMIMAVNNYGVYHKSWAVYEDTNEEIQTEQID